MANYKSLFIKLSFSSYEVDKMKRKSINTKIRLADKLEHKKKKRVLIPSNVKRIVRERAGYHCQRCGEDITEIHHIDHNPSNKSLNNLILLCPTCHKKADTSLISKDELKSMQRRKATRVVYKYE